MKIALVHDYLREYGGAERVVEAMHEMWPEAPLYTSFVDWEALGNQAWRFRDWDIRTSPVADNWVIKKIHSPLRFLAPKIWESFDLSGYDVVLSSSGWFMCRGVKVGDDANEIRDSRVEIRESKNKTTFPKPESRNSKLPLHICYIHHPPRNLYGYATGSAQQNPFIRMYTTIINFFLRHYDWETAQKVDYFIANSEETRRRVEKFYRRTSTVIYPPIAAIRDTRYAIREKKHITHNASTHNAYFLSVGRLTYSKRVDLAIGAANKLKIPLKVVGTGKEESYLRTIAGPTVQFLGSVSDNELAELYAGAKALIFCALDEDFGMVPVEAMAAGTPVIALSQGGVLETVIDQKTGILFTEPTIESLVKAIKQYNHVAIQPTSCIAQAEKFSKARFKRELKTFVEKHYHGTNS